MASTATLPNLLVSGLVEFTSSAWKAPEPQAWKLGRTTKMYKTGDSHFWKKELLEILLDHLGQGKINLFAVTWICLSSANFLQEAQGPREPVLSVLHGFQMSCDTDFASPQTRNPESTFCHNTSQEERWKTRDKCSCVFQLTKPNWSFTCSTKAQCPFAVRKITVLVVQLAFLRSKGYTVVTMGEAKVPDSILATLLMFLCGYPADLWFQSNHSLSDPVCSHCLLILFSVRGGRALQLYILCLRLRVCSVQDMTFHSNCNVSETRKYFLSCTQWWWGYKKAVCNFCSKLKHSQLTLDQFATWSMLHEEISVNRNTNWVFYPSLSLSPQWLHTWLSFLDIEGTGGITRRKRAGVWELLFSVFLCELYSSFQLRPENRPLNTFEVSVSFLA